MVYQVGIFYPLLHPRTFFASFMIIPLILMTYETGKNGMSNLIFVIDLSTLIFNEVVQELAA